MNLLLPRACSRALAAALVLLLSACGGAGGFPEVATPDVSGNDVVLASFEAGDAASLIVADGTGTADAAAATTASVADHASAGKSALKVTLVAETAMIGLTSDGGGGLASDWTGFRSLMVDVTSEKAIDAGAIKLITKAGASYKWCVFSNTQDLHAGQTATLSFRLDWSANTCGATAEDVAAIKYAYVALAGGAGNVLHLDNLRMTKSVRVMALGDSITGSPGCWRQTLWADALVARTSPPVDMVGVRNNQAECATALSGGWDADNAGFGGMLVRSVGEKLGLADAARGDTVFVAPGVSAVAGNLPVWLESARPDVMLIHLGTNDVWNATATASIVAGLDTLVDQARAGNPGMRFVVAQIPLFSPEGCSTDCPTRAAAYNAAIAEWAKCKRSAASPITLADLTVGWDPATMTADGVHPNTTGAAVMGGNWKSAVNAALDAIDTAGSGPDASCVSTDVTDLADGTSASGTFTITSFKTGVGALTPLNNDGNTSASTQATLTLETSGAHATDGSHAGIFTVINPPTGGWVSVGQTGNGGLADWTGYRYLKFDVKTGDAAYGGTIYVQSGADWSKWCQGSDTSIDANASGTVTIDLSACAAIDLTHPQRFGLVAWNTGSFYIDNVRLEAGEAPPPPATDLADGNTTTTTYTISSFKTSAAALSALNNDGNPSASTQATIGHDTSGTHATEGSHAAVFTVIAPPSGGWVSAAQTGNGGLADWSAYRYLKFDVKTGSAAFGGTIYFQSGADWSKWCQGSDASVDANGTGTVTLDLSTCAAVDLANPQRFGLVGYNTGTFYIDNVRLEVGASTTAPDLADGNTSATTFTITSFKTGVDKVTLLNNDGNPSTSSQATLAHDTSGTHASDGANAATFTVINPPSGGAVAIGNTNNGGLADWSAYKTLSFDVKTGDAAFNGVVVLQSGSGWNWCQGSSVDIAANASGTVSLDLTSCTGGDLTQPQRFQMFSFATGTFYVDNIRLVK